MTLPLFSRRLWVGPCQVGANGVLPFPPNLTFKIFPWPISWEILGMVPLISICATDDFPALTFSPSLWRWIRTSCQNSQSSTAPLKALMLLYSFSFVYTRWYPSSPSPLPPPLSAPLECSISINRYIYIDRLLNLTPQSWCLLRGDCSLRPN